MARQSRKRCPMCLTATPTRTVIAGVVLWLHNHCINCVDAERYEKQFQTEHAKKRAEVIA